MSKKAFQTGLSCYKAGQYKEALQHFDEAVKHGGPSLYTILDTRAAVYVKLGKYKEALKDARKTIDTAPDRWQGYARAARIFLASNKLDNAQTMVKMALTRLGEADRRASLETLEAEIVQAKDVQEKKRRSQLDHMGTLPVELFAEIVGMLVDEHHTALLPLLHVCKHWRRVLESCPQVWHTLVLSKRRPKIKAKMWITNSNGRVKRFMVRDSAPDTPDWPGNSLNGILWDQVQVCELDQWRIQQHFRSDVQTCLWPCLKELSVGGQMTGMAPQEFFQGFAHGQPLLLHRLSLANKIVDVGRAVELITTLRKLSLNSAQSINGTWEDFLAVNTSLETLRLEEIESDSSMSEGRLVFDNLTTLEVVNSFVYRLFNASYPTLHTLRIQHSRLSVDTLLKHLVDDNVVFLTELVLDSCRFSDTTPLVSLLRISPALKVLEITKISVGILSVMSALSAHYDPPSTHPLLKNDKPSPLPPPICPNLTHINFSGCPEVQTGPLVNLIKSRLPSSAEATSDTTANVPPSPPIARIESLKIDACPNVDGSWLPRIREAVPYVSCVYMTKKTKYRHA